MNTAVMGIEQYVQPVEVNGVFLPPMEKHFTESPDVGKRYPALDAALKVLPAQRRGLAIDVGAHVGLWARWLVREFKHVACFEPIEEYGDILQANLVVGKRPNWSLYRYALGMNNGTVAMQTYPDNTGMAHIMQDGSVGTGSLATMFPLDDFADEFASSSPDLIKIDVEGYELEVCRGAKRILTDHRPVVVIEQRGNAALRFQKADNEEALKYLERLGMKRVEQVHYDWIMGW